MIDHKKPITAAEVKERRREAIYGQLGHPEDVVALEELYEDVLRAIADGRCDNPAACARAALVEQP